MDDGDHRTEGGNRRLDFWDFQARKIELPVYAGDDPDEWTYRADQYFSLQRLTSAEQLEVDVLCL